AHGFAELGSMSCHAILKLLKMPGRLGELGLDLADMARRSFEKTVEFYREKCGEDTSEWRWGQVHKISCDHRFAGTPLEAFFNMGPEEGHGGPDTVNRGDYGGDGRFAMRVAAAMRMVASAKSRDKAGTVLPGGQSGRRF